MKLLSKNIWHIALKREGNSYEDNYTILAADFKEALEITKHLLEEKNKCKGEKVTRVIKIEEGRSVQYASTRTVTVEV